MEDKPSVSWEEVKSRMLKNPEVAKEIKELEPEYEIIQHDSISLKELFKSYNGDPVKELDWGEAQGEEA